MAKVFKSLTELAEHFKQRGERVIPAVEKAVDRYADFVLSRAQANTPVQTGNLRESEHKEAGETRTGEVSRDIVASAPYAVEVHERPPDEDTAHEGEGTPEGYPGRQYLTRPLRFHQGQFVDGMNQAVAEALEGGK